MTGSTLDSREDVVVIIKMISAKEAIELASQGAEVYVLDFETKEIAPLTDMLEAFPGAFLVASAESEELAEPEEPEPDKPKAKGGPARKEIDKGKIKALYKAGWSQAAIADEMGVSPATICYHIRAMNSEVQDEN